MALTPAQLAERREGITATDVAAIVRLNPYKSVLDVVAEKRGAAPVDADLGPRGHWGNVLEEPIRKDYSERHAVRVTVPGVLTHPKVKHHKATPDGIVWLRGAQEADRGLEIKTHTVWLRGGYGAPGTDEVPLHEIVQCSWNMHVTGLPTWDLVAFIDGLPTDYRITRDLDFEGDLVEAVDRFWCNVIGGGAEPEPDGTDRYAEHLANKFKYRDGSGFVEADKETLAAIAELKAVRLTLDTAENDKKRLEQVIKAVIGEREGIEFPALGPRGETEQITYRKSKDGTAVDAGAVLGDVASAVALARSGGLAELIEMVRSWPAASTLTGNGTKMTAKQILDILTVLGGIDLAALARQHSKPRIGPRVFNCPRTWKGDK